MPSASPVITLLLVANVVMYVVVGASGGGWMDADGQVLIRFGSNFGPLTTGGEWWRLFTSAFLHGGLVHLGVNMLTLVDVGSLCGRLFGGVRFVLIYVLSALAGAAASVWWNPWVNSVGASGALFGVLGAVFAYMLDRRNGVATAVMKTHLTSLSVFIIYGLVNGFASTGIDNGAHVGGLVAGLVTGWALSPSARSDLRPLGGMAACLAAVVALAWYTPNTRPQYDAEKRLRQDIDWLSGEERQLNDEARRVFERARQPGDRDQDLAPAVHVIAERWSAAHARIAAYEVPEGSPMHAVQANLVQFLDLRRQALEALERATTADAGARSEMETYTRLMKASNEAAGRLRASGKPKDEKGT